MATNSISGVTHQELSTFKLFGKLPTEIRLTIWELALPHRRLLRIKAPKKLTRGKVTNSPYGFIDLKTGRNLGIPKYALDFGTTDENIGMLKACWESRLVTVKIFSVHLPAQNPKKEIRVGPDDLVVLDKWERILKSLHEITCWGDPTTPRCLEKLRGIRTLALAVHNNINKGEGSMADTSKTLIQMSCWQRKLRIALPDLRTIAIICDIGRHTVSRGSLAGFVEVEDKDGPHYGSEERHLVREAFIAKESVEDTIEGRAPGFPRIEIMVKEKADTSINA